MCLLLTIAPMNKQSKTLARKLTQVKFRPWLDKWNLVADDPWQEAIEKALADCSTCAVIIGPNGVAPWQQEEMRAAIAQRVEARIGTFRVIPVLPPGASRKIAASLLPS